MERKLLFTLIFAFALLSGTRAQVRLIIDRPLSLAQEITNIATITNDGTWGFGADTTGPVTAPVFCIAGLDSFACSALPAGSLAGKIAIVHRGPDPALGLGAVCGFGTKALNCQNAGAVGVLVVYEPRDGQANDAMPSGIIGNNGTNTDGLLVRIPVIVISRPMGRYLKPLLCDSGQITMGGFLGQYEYDLRIAPDSGAVSPPAAAMPNFMIRDTGHFAFTPNLLVRNIGSRAENNATARATITRFHNGVTDVIYDQTVPVPPLERAVVKADTAVANFPHFDIATAVPGTDRLGIYTLLYSLSSPNGTPNPGDDELQYVFQITQDKFSMCRLDFNSQDLLTNDFVSPALTGIAPTNRVYRYGSVFETHAIDLGDSVLLNSVRFGVRVGLDSVDLTSLNVTAEVYEWNDADNNGGISDAELNQVANGLLTFDNDSLNGKKFTVTMEDLSTGSTPVLLEANKTYVALMSYRGDDMVAWTYEDKGFSYVRYYTEQAPRVINPVFINQWYGSYSESPAAGIRVDFSFRDNGTPLKNADLLLAGAVTLAPNPARDRFRITVSDQVKAGPMSYQLTDLSGRVLRQGSVVGSETIVTTTGLAAGLYQVAVRSAQGSTVKKLAISR